MTTIAIAPSNLWVPPPASLSLSSPDVHLWCAALDRAGEDIWQLYQTLSDDERDRANRFHFETDQTRFIVARGLLRNILSRYLNLDAKALQFCYENNGKPALIAEQNEKRLQFNLSHSQGWALYAIAQDRAIGVDIEYVRQNFAWHEMAARCLTPSEYAVLQTLPSDIQCRAFFTAWTRKEAYLKAKGLGLSMPLDHVEVTLTPGETAVLLNVHHHPQEPTRWLLQDLDLAAGYVGAVAVVGDRLLMIQQPLFAI